MRERQEVLEKFGELQVRYLKERKEQFLSRQPINCVHNIMLHVRGKGKFRFCQNSLVLARHGQKMFLCQDADTAQRCRLFTCQNTEESVKTTFDEILKSPARCGNDYPKLAMLIWFLQEFELHSRVSRLGQMIRRFWGSIWGILTFRWW